MSDIPQITVPELASVVQQSVFPYSNDLILTKRFAARPKDLEDIRLLEVPRTTEENDRGER